MYISELEFPSIPDVFPGMELLDHNAKECSNYSKTGLISHASKLRLKILHARLQQDMNRELPGV